MSTFKVSGTVVLLLLGATALSQESPGLGEPVSAEHIAAIDNTVLPNGDGLPAGSGTARDGAMVYQQHCLACHGEGGTDGINDRLVGGHGSMTSERPVKTVGSFWPYATTVFDYVRRSMPLTTPGVLSDDETYAVTAYLLYLNEIVGEDDQIDANTLPEVKMPNRDNFVWDYSPMP
jgi:cytochrome c